MKQHRPEKLGNTHVTYKPKERVLPLNGARWRRLRAQVLAEEPLCSWCLEEGRYVASVDVDHINNDGDDNRRENLTGMCHECHARKTQAEMNGQDVKRKGCDRNGFPLDPDHGWNSEKITSNRGDTNRPPSHENTAAK